MQFYRRFSGMYSDGAHSVVPCGGRAGLQSAPQVGCGMYSERDLYDDLCGYGIQLFVEVTGKGSDKL